MWRGAMVWKENSSDAISRGIQYLEWHSKRVLNLCLSFSWSLRFIFFVFTFNLLASGQLEAVLVQVVAELRRSMRTICFTAQIQNLLSA